MAQRRELDAALGAAAVDGGNLRVGTRQVARRDRCGGAGALQRDLDRVDERVGVAEGERVVHFVRGQATCSTSSTGDVV